MILAAASIAAVVLFLERIERERPSGKEFPQSVTRRGAVKEAPVKAAPSRKQARETPKPAAPATGNHGRPIAVIIDDIGFDLGIVKELAGIPAPIAFAVLPHTPHAAEAAGILHKAGKEILLHLPMEPRSYPEASPGAGALMVDMEEKQIRRQLRENLDAVPYVSGVNNHMGSRFMEDEFRLSIVMEELGKRGLYFVDSRTTPASRGREAANRKGVRFAERDIFIDHFPGYEAAVKNLTGPSLRKGKNEKPVLMIGHPQPDTVRALKDTLPRWRQEGARLIAFPTFLEIYMEENRSALAASERSPDRKEMAR